MEKTQLQLISTAAYAPVSGENATPFSQQTVVLTKQDYIALKWVSRCRRVRYHRSAGAGPHTTHSTASLSNDVWVCPAPRYCYSTARLARDPKESIGGVRLDDGTAGQISL